MTYVIIYIDGSEKTVVAETRQEALLNNNPEEILYCRLYVED